MRQLRPGGAGGGISDFARRLGRASRELFEYGKEATPTHYYENGSTPTPFRAAYSSPLDGDWFCPNVPHPKTETISPCSKQPGLGKFDALACSTSEVTPARSRGPRFAVADHSAGAMRCERRSLRWKIRIVLPTRALGFNRRSASRWCGPNEGRLPSTWMHVPSSGPKRIWSLIAKNAACPSGSDIERAIGGIRP
jgi:hypothetical protein